jgi:hypothetical protein
MAAMVAVGGHCGLLLAFMRFTKRILKEGVLSCSYALLPYSQAFQTLCQYTPRQHLA